MALKFTSPLVARRFLNSVPFTPVALVALDACHPTICASLSIFVIVHHENVYHTIDGLFTVKS